MSSLWKYTERYLVLENINGLIDDFLILSYSLKTITFAHDGHNFQEGKNPSQDGILEDVCTRHKDFRTIIDTQHYQGIHQRISVIGGKDDGSVPGNILLSHVQYATVRSLDQIGYITIEKVVRSIVILYFLLAILGHNINLFCGIRRLR
jgi:hypothetical protein